VSEGSILELPEVLRPYAWLLGRWVGVGLGQYPTIDDFRFGQEVSFATDGRPFLYYSSRSWLLDDEGNRVRPLGTETGFWRPQPDTSVEVTLAHPTGYAELWSGSLTVQSLENAQITAGFVELRTSAVARTLTAKEYTDGHRLYGIRDGRLHWTFDMAAVGQQMGNHLAATLYPEESAGGSTTEEPG
jgi:hypothetical protein